MTVIISSMDKPLIVFMVKQKFKTLVKQMEMQVIEFLSFGMNVLLLLSVNANRVYEKFQARRFI